MLKLTCLTLGAYQVNCYIVRSDGTNHAIVIDPGYEPQRILDTLEKLGLSLDAILLTHGHFDHVGAVRELAAETDCKVYLAEADLSLPPQITAGPLYYTDLYPKEGSVSAADLTIRVIPTPGHTPGSVCLLIGDAMFSGDTLFEGSCGRTDLPGGSTIAIRQSLKMLAGLPGDWSVFPGHGDSTSLAQEKKYNPYM